MSQSADGFTFIDRIAECDRDEWNLLADQYDTPLLDWGWLHALEVSESVTPQEGWIPQHLLLRTNGRLVAAAPLYVKTHSAGEFVFDYAWADVARQLEVEYYPKLVAMSPLTPAIGYRFLVDASQNEREIVAQMIAVIDKFCRVNKMHGFSILWPEPDFAELVSDATSGGPNADSSATDSGRQIFSQWQHQHFRWENESFQTFDDYLAGFTKNQRRNIRRERASMANQGITVEAIGGDELPEPFYQTMYRYYLNTNEQFGMWAALYLTEGFFTLLPSLYAERLLFVAAFERGVDEPVGMSMLLRKRSRLIGRYWGADRFITNLHFNVCYYRPIEWAIGAGVQAFDPGMGSSHKIRRGFRAVGTSSLHSFADERMRLVMKMNIDKINRYESEHIDELNAHLPFTTR